jgi:pilus assembly protein Flp/PilA
MARTLKLFLQDDSGATSIEYAMLASGVSLAIIAVVQGLGSKLKLSYESVSKAMN